MRLAGALEGLAAAAAALPDRGAVHDGRVSISVVVMRVVVVVVWSARRALELFFV
jgi:hypothetical protein